MKTIYKYYVPNTPQFFISLPAESEILCVQNNDKTGSPCIWVLVDVTKPHESREFDLFETGQIIHDEWNIERKYIGTFQSWGALLQ